MELFVADVLLASTESGDPRVNIGEQATGQGFGADTAVWGSGPAFVSVPNPPSDDGTAQALVGVEGNSSRVLASRDNRYVGAAGALAPGDAAIVSNSDACLRLVSADDTLELKSTDMAITLDGAAGTVTVAKGGSSVVLADGGITITYAPPSGPSVVIALTAAGVAITATAVTVNSIPLQVP
jgi:hypothetical protein